GESVSDTVEEMGGTVAREVHYREAWSVAEAEARFDRGVALHAGAVFDGREPRLSAPVRVAVGSGGGDFLLGEEEADLRVGAVLGCDVLGSQLLDGRA